MGERMNQSKALASHIPITTAAFVVLTIALICGLVGQKAWSHQTSLTKNFETCMEAAPFKNPLSHGKGEAVMTPEDLPRHFEVFDQIFRETGLPPIWDSNKLVPWTVFHKKSILVAKQCHEKLGIQQPQHELRGTYAKPIWDPNSEIGQKI